MIQKSAITAAVVIILAAIIIYLTSCERPAPSPTPEASPEAQVESQRALVAAGRTFPSDGSMANVQSIHDTQAVDGDTITIPAGTFTNWGSATLKLTKAVTIQGQTVVNVNSGTSDKRTALVDNGTDRNKPMIELRGGGQRLTGLAFVKGSTSNMYNGGIRLESGTKPVRIDNCHTDDVYWQPNIGWYDYNYGVIDHFIQTKGHGGIVYVHMGAHGNGGDKGDLTFGQAAGFGGPNFLFIETGWWEHGPDIHVGGKACVRYNHIDGTHGPSDGQIVSHGTARTYKDGRGGRCYEVYNNDIHGNNDYRGIDGPDSGSAVWHDNTWTNNGLHLHEISTQVYRASYSFGTPFYGASGRIAWDKSDGQVYASGTLTGTNGASTLTDSTKNWTQNQWVGYTVSRPDNQVGAITSNTNNTLTVYVIYGQGWATGNTYEIRKVTQVFDQPGYGSYQNINRSIPAWSSPQSEPMYSWNNKNLDNNSPINFVTVEGGSFTIKEGRDFFNNTQKPGYAPYVYPHPMVSGGGASPTPNATPTATTAPSPSATATATSTATVPPVPSATATVTATATVAPTATATATATAQPSPTPAEIILQPGQSVIIRVPPNP